jgi:hypothetical protein
MSPTVTSRTFVCGMDDPYRASKCQLLIMVQCASAFVLKYAQLARNFGGRL